MKLKSKLLYRKQASKSIDFEAFQRYLAESNCSTRFCRPLPNRSAKVPNRLVA